MSAERQTAEQEARDMLDRMGVEDAQSRSAGDVVELANLIAALHASRGEAEYQKKCKEMWERWIADVKNTAGCICFGNWRQIVKECEPLFGREYRDHHGELHTFFGVVHTDDDYCYGMVTAAGRLKLLTCVGSIEGNGYTLVENTKER